MVIRDLHKGYPIDGGRVDVLRGLNLELPRGGITVIVGKSGCGKTTLLRLIAGLEAPDSGDIALTPGTKTGIMFQEDRLMPWLNCEKNIAFGGKIGKVRLSELIATVGLTGFERAYPDELSGGMRQRAALARTLAASASLILMDEPFAALDFFTRGQMQKELLRIRQKTGTSCVLVTHNIDEALTLADKLAVISGGKVAREYEIAQPAAQRDILAPAFTEIRRDMLNAMI